MRWRVLAMALVVAAAACSSGDGRGDSTTSVAVSPTTTGPRDTVAEALQFTGATVGGGRFDGGDYVGRNLALWFWAPY